MGIAWRLGEDRYLRIGYLVGQSKHLLVLDGQKSYDSLQYCSSSKNIPNHSSISHGFLTGSGTENPQNRCLPDQSYQPPTKNRVPKTPSSNHEKIYFPHGNGPPTMAGVKPPIKSWTHTLRLPKSNFRQVNYLPSPSIASPFPPFFLPSPHPQFS